MAHGLAKAAGATAVEEYFEVPGYRLKRFDSNGEDMRAKVREGLELAGVFKDAGFRSAVLQSRLAGPRQATGE